MFYSDGWTYSKNSTYSYTFNYNTLGNWIFKPKKKRTKHWYNEMIF